MTNTDRAPAEPGSDQGAVRATTTDTTTTDGRRGDGRRGTERSGDRRRSASRTRTRSRARGGDDTDAPVRRRGRGRDAGTSDDLERGDRGAGAADDERGAAGGARASEGGDDGDEGSRRRRRRGRRGRGGRGRGGGDRTRGGDAAAEVSDEVADATGRERSVEDEGDGRSRATGKGNGRSKATGKGSGRSGGKGGGSGKSGGNGSGKGGGSGKGERARSGGGAKDGGRGAGRGDASSDGHDGDRDVEKAIAASGTRVAAKRGRRPGNGGGGGRRHQRPAGVSEEVRRAILEGPPRTMLVTAREDRTQIAVLEDRTVVEHYVTRKEDVTYVGNIYMARVQNVLPGMEAAFLDIGRGRNGVLYAGEVLYDELDLEEGDDQRIENALKPGQKVLVQVTKDPMGTKGPRLTMHLSLAGRYLVLAPSSDLFGISRKLTDKERDRLRRTVKRVKPDEHGIIVRTAAEGASEDQIVADVERLLAKWKRVEEAAADAKALTTVYEEPSLVVKVIRDNFGPEFERCIVDDEQLYRQVRGYLAEVAPELLDKVELYGAPLEPATADDTATGAQDGTDASSAADDATDEVDGTAADAAADDDGGEDGGDLDADDGEGSSRRSGVSGELTDEQFAAAAERREDLPSLFVAYDVADQLRKATGKKVWLPSGGYLVIETTEAMKVIDVNTGKFTGGKNTNLEEVVLKTNLEAAEEIVRQLRLRDMGGIIIIDFIDMLLKANQDQVVRRLKRELLRDRTKTRVSEVSRLGLVQMTRKNVSQGLIESFSHTCEHCEGRGIISELD